MEKLIVIRVLSRIGLSCKNGRSTVAAEWLHRSLKPYKNGPEVPGTRGNLCIDVPNIYFQAYTWDMFGQAVAGTSTMVLEFTVLPGAAVWFYERSVIHPVHGQVRSKSP